MQFNQDTIDLLLHTIKIYGWMDLPASSMSMYPFIKEGNICRYTKFDLKTVKRGDILLYYTPSGQLLTHRLLYIDKTNPKYVFLKGDLNSKSVGPIEINLIIGKLITIDKKKKKVYLNDLKAILWGYFITTFPLLSKTIKIYIRFKNKFKKRLSSI